jgi:hypothetical protein
MVLGQHLVDFLTWCWATLSAVMLVGSYQAWVYRKHSWMLLMFWISLLPLVVDSRIWFRSQLESTAWFCALCKVPLLIEVFSCFLQQWSLQLILGDLCSGISSHMWLLVVRISHKFSKYGVLQIADLCWHCSWVEKREVVSILYLEAK